MQLNKTISIIGCGKVGSTLARLWHANQVLQIQDILNRTQDSAQSAVDFIGAGQAVHAYANLRGADIYMIASPDDQIAHCCDQLAQSGKLHAGSIVFHCSGALPSSVLQSALACGAAVASVHPIRSFAAPEKVASEFVGTYCGVEGDAQALKILQTAFSAIGAQFVTIDSEAKILYHAAAVFSCNYLTTLLDVAQQAYAAAGVAPDSALQLMQPLVRETVDNIFRLGPAQALTGPIARGDLATAEKQQQAVENWNKVHGDLYRQFMQLTIDLAARRPSQ